MRLSTRLSRTAGFVLVGGIAAVACGGNPNFPPAVVARAPSEAAGLRVVLHRDSRCDAPEFSVAVAKALKDSGIEIVPFARAAYDIGVAFNCGDFGPPYDRYSWELRLESAPDIRIGNREAPTSWLERTRLAAGNAADYDTDPLFGEAGPMNECFQRWEREGRPRNDLKAGMMISETASTSTVGVYSGTPKPEWHEQAAYFLVNKLIGCDGLAKIASIVKDSGLAASASGEDLPVATLMNLCDHGGTVGLRKIRTSEDACDAAASRDPQAAARVRKRRQQQAASAADAAEYNRTHLSNGCTRDNPVSCGSGENTWCCPNAYPTCGGCGSNCCPYVAPQTVFVPVPSGGGDTTNNTTVTSPDSCACQGFVCGGTPVPGCSAQHPGAKCDCGQCINAMGYTHHPFQGTTHVGPSAPYRTVCDRVDVGS